MIKWFSQVRESDFGEVGGKGLRLSRMYNDGLNVPDGFVITSQAYEEYISQNGLGAEIETILRDDVSTQETSRRVKALFRPDAVSQALQTEVRNAFSRIAGGRAAVRSSSTAEDLPGNSFAGQYSSYLNVTEVDLIENLVLCWQSLWNERAIEYRRKYNVIPGFSHAVVVQEMINSQISGVVFTANPLTGQRNQLLINAAYGLGEAIVSGHVHPDQYTVDKRSGQVIKKELATKEVLCRYGEEGIEIVPVDAERRTLSSLGEPQVQLLVTEARRIEDSFGAPQDIEFAFDDQDIFYVLQSRDITSLFPIDHLVQDGKLRAYLCASSVLLGMKEPFTPLGFDLFSHMFPTLINVMTAQKRLLDNRFVKHEAGRIFVDVTYLMSNRFVARQFAKAFSGNDLPLAPTMNQLIDQHGREFRRQGIKFKIPWGVFRYGLSVMGKLQQARQVPPEKRYERVKAIGEAVFQEYAQKARTLKSVEEKLAFIREALTAAFKMTQDQAWYCTEFTNLPKVEKRISKWYGDKFDTALLNQAFPGCVSVEMGLALNQLAKFFDAEQEAPAPDHPKVQEFLARFGCRSTVELDFGVKRWYEDPEYIINLIESYMVDQMYDRNIAEVHETAAKVDRLIEGIYQTVKSDKGERQARKIRQQITEARRAAGMREYPKFAIVRILSIAREVMLGVGQEYQTLGLIDEPEDIFFLYADDIRGKQGLKQTATENRAAYRKEMARTSIPRIVLNTGETYYSAQTIDPNSKVLQGMPLSPGTYEGKVRIVFDPNTSELLEGEVLVTESTNPAWTPLFMAAKGLIMEYGGPVSHGGIVAREYGIPAVVGIPSATNLLQDGQMVRINGESGIVEIMD